MAILFSGNRTFAAGLSESPIFTVPAQFQVPGLEVQIQFSTPADLPNGLTTVTIFFSFDGGNTFEGNPTFINIPGDLSVIHGVTVPLHFSYALGGRTADHVKYSVNTPAQFTTAILVQTL
jgi:hypothetical protein